MLVKGSSSSSSINSPSSVNTNYILTYTILCLGSCTGWHIGCVASTQINPSLLFVRIDIYNYMQVCAKI